MTATTQAQPSFDRVAGEAFLEQLRADLAEVERTRYRGKFTEPLGASIADGLRIAEGYITEAAAEIRAGFDPMKLLESARRSLMRSARQSWEEPD
jgi:hypothetical protein